MLSCKIWLCFLPASLFLCACTTTLSRSPVVQGNKRYAIAIVSSTSATASGPETIESPAQESPREQRSLPTFYGSYGWSENSELSFSPFYAQYVGGLASQIKFRQKNSSRFMFTWIADFYIITISTPKTLADGEILPNYAQTSSLSYSLEVAPSLGYRLNSRTIIFAGASMGWLSVNSTYIKSSAEKLNLGYSDIVYGTFTGITGTLAKLKHGVCIGEVTLLASSNPIAITNKEHKIFANGLANIKYLF